MRSESKRLRIALEELALEHLLGFFNFGKLRLDPSIQTVFTAKVRNPRRHARASPSFGRYVDPDKLCPRETLYELIWPGSQGFPGADIEHLKLFIFTANLHKLKVSEIDTKKCEIKGRYWMGPIKKL